MLSTCSTRLYLSILSLFQSASGSFSTFQFHVVRHLSECGNPGVQLWSCSISELKLSELWMEFAVLGTMHLLSGPSLWR